MKSTRVRMGRFTPRAPFMSSYKLLGGREVLSNTEPTVLVKGFCQVKARLWSSKVEW